MKRSILVFFWLLSTSLFAQNVEWAHTIGGSGRDQPQSIKSDQNGNVVVAGTFVGTPIVFSDSNIILHGSDSTDIYLYKKSSSGELLWANKLSSVGHDHVNDIGIDNEGNIFVAGWFRHTLVLGGIENTISITSPGTRGAFIAKYSPDGHILAAYSLGSGVQNDEFLTVSFDHDDNLILTGHFFLEIDFDFSDASYMVDCNGLVFLKLTTNLEFISIFNLNNRNMFPTCVEFTDAGEMIFAGRNRGSIQFPTGGGVGQPDNSTNNGFVIKLDNNNEFLWKVAIMGDIFQMVTDIHVSETGETYIAGDFTKVAYFMANPSSHIFLSDSESRDVFFAKLSTDGDFDWIKIIGGPKFDEVAEIEIDSDSNIILVGRYSDTMDFDPSLATIALTPQGNASSFIVKYTPDGEYIAAYSFQNSSYNSASGIVLSPTNEIYVTGWFTENINFDPNQGGLSFDSNGVQDTYLVKLGAITVGLKESAHQSKISIFPNPADDQVKIEAENLQKIEFFDIHGKLVLSKSPGLRQNQYSISVSHLPAGVYFIRLSGDNYISFSKKLVIMP